MPVPRPGSWVAFGAAMMAAEVRGCPALHHQQDKLLTPEIVPGGWFSTVILSDPGHLCCMRPGWTPH